MSESAEVKRMGTRSKGEAASNTSRISPRRRNIVLGAGAVRSTNVEKAKDGSLIYKRRSSASNNSALNSSPPPETEESSTEKTQSAPAECRIHKRMRTVHTNSGGEEVESDGFCWLCHREGDGVCCELCPRMYHLKCLNIESIASDWVCPECEKILQAECVDTRSRAMSLITVDQLCVLLKYALQRMKHTDSADFHKPVDLNDVPHYTDYIHNPMDLTTLEKNIRKKLYGSTEAFLADAKYILHNCIVFNGERNKLTTNAKMVLKISKHEMNEIEICPDCYMNSCTKQQENWFCEPCRYPHTLVWAKMKGYPYWPAKALRVVNGQVDVRFFGEHDRAWVPVGQVYLLSKDPPVSIKKGRGGYDQSMEELDLHIERLTFEYAPNKMVYDPYAHIKATEDGGKATPTRLSTKSSSSTPSSSKSRSPAITTSLRSGPSKSPEKSPSIITRTASAVKLKYSSIISTRHTKLKGQTIGDNIIVAKDDPDKGNDKESSRGKSTSKDDDDDDEPECKKAKLMTPSAMGGDQNAGHKQDHSDVECDAKEEKVEQPPMVDDSLCEKDKKQEEVSKVSEDKTSSGDEKLTKVFLLNEDMIEETKPKPSLCSLLDVVPRIKHPDKKVIDEIENKIKRLQDQVNDEKCDGDDNDKNVDDEDDKDDCHIDNKDKTKDDDDDSKERECDAEETEKNRKEESKSHHEIEPVSEIQPMDVESESGGLKSGATTSENTTKQVNQQSPTKNAFLERIVASCKEKLGVDNTEVADISLRLSVSEAEDESTSSANSTSETLSDDESEQHENKNSKSLESPAQKTNSSVSPKPISVEVIESTSGEKDRMVGQDQNQSVRSNDQKKVLGDAKSDPIAMENDSCETVAAVSSEPSHSGTRILLASPKELCDKREVIVITEPDSPDDPIAKETSERRASVSGTKRTLDVRSSLDGRAGQMKTNEAGASQRLSPSTVKIKPQNVHAPKLQTATVLPEKVMPPAQKTVISLVNGSNGLSASPSKQQDNIPSDFSPATPEIDFTGLDISRYTNKVMKTVQNTLQEFCMDMIHTEVGSVFRQHLQLEVKRLEWRHQQELNEIKHTANLKLLELRAAMELEKEKAIDNMIRDLKYKYEAEKKQAVEETKKKQWCANCGKEAIFYCCWNTSYCDYPCQQAHWPQHMSSCTQSQSSQQSHDSRTSHSDTASNPAPTNVDKWQPPETQGNRIMTQPASVIHSQPHNIQYIQPPQPRLPTTQVGGSVLRYIQPNPGNPGQRFQHNNPQQFQLSAMNQMNQSQPPLIMVSTGPTHQGPLRPIISHNTRAPQSLILPHAGRLPPNMMQGSGMHY